MKIAITGKGGAGKTTFSATLSWILSNNYKVFAIDADPDMNLGTNLGINKEVTPLSRMKNLIKERTGAEPGAYGQIFKINPKISDLPDKLSIKHPQRENLRLLTMGTIEEGGEGCVCPASVMLKALLRHMLLKRNEIIILDMEAGIEHLGRGTAESVDLMIIVIEPSLKSLESAKRIKKLAEDIGIEKIEAILNKISNSKEKDFIKGELKKMGLSCIGTIPFDDTIIKADIEGKPLAFYKSSKAFRSIERMAEKILTLD